MDSVSFLKFWKLTASPSSNNLFLSSHPPKPDKEDEDDEDENEDEDSFFDLELLSVSTFENHNENQAPDHKISMEDNKKRVGFKEEMKKKLESHSTMADHHIKLCFHEQKLQEQTDSISKRKILPIEPTSKPQSPIQLLKSAPKFPVFIFKKQKSMGKNRYPTKQETRLLSRENSTRKTGSILRNLNDDPLETSSKRFPKEMVQKYLKMIKPLYEKVLKKHTDNTSFPGDQSSPADSPMREKHENFPAGTGIRSVCKHLGKSKSASAAGALTVAPSNRRDDSLLQQHDGIQGAILHCKRSFNAPTEQSVLSRSDSLPSQERPRNQLSSEDLSKQEIKEEEGV